MAILSLPDNRCVFLAACHDAAITTIKWRPKEDFLLVACEDSSVYVWQLETRKFGLQRRNVIQAVVYTTSGLPVDDS